MRKKQMKTINIFLFIGFLFFIIGIIFFAAGSAILISGNSFMKNAEKTTAEISEIDSYYSGSSRLGSKKHYNVIVEYVVDGEVYERTLNEYNSGMYEGKEIEIYYNPDNPSEIKTGSKNIRDYFYGNRRTFCSNRRSISLKKRGKETTHKIYYKKRRKDERNCYKY